MTKFSVFTTDGRQRCGKVLETELKEALKYTHFELKSIVTQLHEKINFPGRNEIYCGCFILAS